MMTRRAALFLLALSTASTVMADDKAPKGDLLKLQGTWTAQVGPEDQSKIRLSFTGNRFQLTMTKSDGNEYTSDGEITIDEETKPHKSIVWRKLTDPNGAELGDIQSIYTFENEDMLKVCSGGPGEDRPTEFKEGENNTPPPFLTVLKREKTDEKAKDAEKPAAASKKGDLAKLQGKWTTKVGSDSGNKITIAITIAIKDHDVTFSGTAPNGKDFELKGEIKLDDQAKPSKTLDWVNFTGPQGNAAPDNLGIYEIEDADTIKVCIGGPGNERPTEFKEGDDGGHPHILILKRSKD